MYREFCNYAYFEVIKDFYIQGFLGVYELNRMELLKDVFIWAYERSCVRYAMIRQSLGEPDPFMLTHRNHIRSLITKIISENITLAKASANIATEAGKLPESERAKLTESVETELMSLHEGNFALYMERPSVFNAWKKKWGR